jgi:hypothetical protein
MNVIDYIMITCNLKKCPIKICYEIQLLKIPPKNLFKLSGNHNMIKRYYSMFNCNQSYQRQNKLK